MDEQPSMSEDGEDMDQTVDSSNGKEVTTAEESSDMEPYVGMEFESEEAAKVFYDAYATRLGFIMRVDAFRRSMRDGKVVWRRLVCNKEGFRKLRPRRSENRKPRAITREGCKAMIVVKKEKTGKWVVTRFVKEHNHPLVAIPSNGRRSVLLSQTPDEKDVKIRELTAELQRERKRSAAYQEQLYTVLRDMEEHSNHLSRNIEDVVQSVREIESKSLTVMKKLSCCCAQNPAKLDIRLWLHLLLLHLCHSQTRHLLSLFALQFHPPSRRPSLQLRCRMDLQYHRYCC
ncbi:protein FAR1-RELATED SEQUENCE 7 isoform X2 [Ricinus communis]|uniref:protein FAR1-RELATED SEQUENCE 7 isoform X1 n=1 Tax=Ricinus communis TaxID=3988 RepID=UPI000D69B5CE|nr:protein FAR1-RELATED SEQUENCE 7 isoform X1 [Ricinus communis]XP_048233192.1 protein FAR1-RELATED SEQUENCE 7 isoform X2 [Ricinus communis]|eukprot:XP_025014568.1 protein FAR1-RELATED SEQUENCE 7 isoform X3 [Ricinus communis]